MALNLKAPNSGGSDGDLAGKAFLDPVENRLTLSEIQEQLKSKAFGDYNPAKLEVSSGIDMHTIMHFPAEKIAYNVLVEAHSTPILSNQNPNSHQHESHTYQIQTSRRSWGYLKMLSRRYRLGRRFRRKRTPGCIDIESGYEQNHMGNAQRPT